MRSIRAAARAALVVMVVLVATVGTAPPASAHATLRQTEPASGAVLRTAPERVVLRFSERVELSFGAIRVYDASGERLDTGTAYHPEGAGSAVALDLPELEDGGYVVTWRVVSADAHPVRGAFTFRIGPTITREDTADLAKRLLASEGGNPLVGAVFGFVRFAAYLSLVVLVGGAAFVMSLWSSGLREPRARRLLLWAWITLVTSSVLAIALQGAYASGLGLDGAVRWTVFRGVLDTRFGQAWGARVLLLVAGGIILRARLRAASGSRWIDAALGVIALGVLTTAGFAGHPGTDPSPLIAMPTDVVHLGAVSVWLGGIAMLVCVVLRHTDAASVEGPVARFSRVAPWSVALILATGLLQGWRQSGSVDAVTSTTYGRMVLIKLGLFSVMVAVAWLSRSWVRRRVAGTESSVSGLRRSVGVEAGIAVAILVVTALLVNVTPARTALAQPASYELQAGEVLVDITVDPAKAGPVDVHLYTLDEAGAVRDVEDAIGTLSLPGQGIDGIEVPFQRVGPGHFAAYGMEIPIPGSWLLKIAVRTSDINESRAETRVRIR